MVSSNVHTAQALWGNAVLSILKLRECQINVDGMSQIARGLMSMTTLTIIDLSFNAMSSSGVKDLGKDLSILLQ